MKGITFSQQKIPSLPEESGAAMTSLWAAQWYSRNRVDGEHRHLLNEDCLPVLFRTRARCRAYIQQKYGYIKDREDLRAEPHGWRVPRAVKVSIRD